MIQFEIFILDQLGIVPSKPEYLSPLTVLHTSSFMYLYKLQVVYFTHIEDIVENSLKSIQCGLVLKIESCYM